MVPRPDYEKRWSDAEHPVELDLLLKALGAEVIDFPLKTHCCGGHMTQISEPVALDLINRLLKNAADYEADVIVTLCPMCQLNLDGYQDAVLPYGILLSMLSAVLVGLTGWHGGKLVFDYRLGTSKGS